MNETSNNYIQYIEFSQDQQKEDIREMTDSPILLLQFIIILLCILMNM